jgi:hypothetical protein
MCPCIVSLSLCVRGPPQSCGRSLVQERFLGEELVGVELLALDQGVVEVEVPLQQVDRLLPALVRREPEALIREVPADVVGEAALCRGHRCGGVPRLRRRSP